LPSSPCLEGRVGLVVGASRGFGAALALALASQGATVYASFNHGRAGAELLAMNAAAGPGRLLLAQGDATDPTWCAETRERLLADCGRLDFLICNAFPTPVPLALHPASTDRVVDYAARGLRTVAEPLAGFIGQLAATRGWAAVVSSSYVNTAPPEWPHYVAAKASCEALLRAVVNQHRAVSGLIVRPPPLLTDLTNTPLARRAAVPPEPLAAAVVRRLSGAPAPGSTVLIDDTPPPLDG
ncbi:MAG: SDR family NAD(P)-dependent oxidoreductase, partial [Acidimicrobiales bacterium]